MIYFKSPQEIKIMKEGGVILAEVIKAVAQKVKTGVKLSELNRLAEKLINQAGAYPAFLGYRPPWSDKKYPFAICTSVNEVIVHGLPTDRELREGDVLKIDMGVLYKGFYTDSAVTVAVGNVSQKTKKQIQSAKKVLERAIKECRIGKTIGDIGFIIKKEAQKAGLRPAKGLTGHGIGRHLHEDPNVFNEGKRGKGLKLTEGLVIAVEPMLTAGKPDLKELPDGGFATKDGSLTFHFEHTVAVTKQGPQILTSTQ